MANEKELLGKLIERWSGACQDKSGSDMYTVQDGRFHFAIAPSNHDKSEVLTRLSGIPSDAQQQGYTWQWESVADTVFAQKLPSQIPGYEQRAPQLHMARMVQRAHEMQQHAVIEAGTGTGKSYGYLYPTMELGLKIIVSTSNKALQAQLTKKDIPTVLRSYPGKRFALAQGKSNYACKDKAANVELTGQLATWFLTTTTGNTEDIQFPVDYKELAKLTADDGCAGRQCQHYHDCFYYQEKGKRKEADIIVTNHALLAIHLANPDAEILPEVDMIIVDEAHKFGAYIRNTFASEIKLSAIAHHIDTVKRANIDHLPLLQAAEKFTAQVQAKLVDANPATIQEMTVIESGHKLAILFRQAAEIIFPAGDLPATAEARPHWRQANQLRSFAEKLCAVSATTPTGYVRWVENRQDAEYIINAPWDIAKIASAFLYPGKPPTTSRTLCSLCLDDLGDTVAVLGNRGYCAKCIAHNDPMGDAETMSFNDYLSLPVPESTQAEKAGTPFVFCSATIATPTVGNFMKSLGIDSALTMVAASPFDYKKNAILYVPNGTTPDPKHDPKGWETWVANDMGRMAIESRGGAFLLFSSYRTMHATIKQIRASLFNMGLTVLVQGEHSKAQIVAEFKAKDNCVLLGTKSFWEGVDVQGYNLRLVYVDKIPFAPPHPLTTAMKDGGAGDWFSIDLPLAIQDLKQGAGRLIRTAEDKGVIAIGDTRIRTAPYGRNQILPSLPPAPLVATFEQAADFFQRMRIENDRKLTPMEIFSVDRAINLVEPVEIDGVPF